MFANKEMLNESIEHLNQSPFTFPSKYEVTYVYTDTISRIFLALSDVSNIESLNNKTQLPFLFTTKPIPITFTYKIGESTSLEYTKKITWYLTSKDVPTQINYSFNLTANTLDNSTLLIFNLQIVQHDKINPEHKQRIFTGCKNACYEMINNIEMLLQANNEHIYHYGSIMIHAPIKKIWNFIVKGKILKSLFIGNFKMIGNPEEVGSIVIYKFLGKKENDVKMKVSYICKDDTKKKWKYRLIPIDGMFQNQELRYLFISVNDNKTFLGIYHAFQEKVDSTLMNEVSIKKKKYLSKLKELIEMKNIHSI